MSGNWFINFHPIFTHFQTVPTIKLACELWFLFLFLFTRVLSWVELLLLLLLLFTCVSVILCTGSDEAALHCSWWILIRTWSHRGMDEERPQHLSHDQPAAPAHSPHPKSHPPFPHWGLALQSILTIDDDPFFIILLLSFEFWSVPSSRMIITFSRLCIQVFTCAGIWFHVCWVYITCSYHLVYHQKRLMAM